MITYEEALNFFVYDEATGELRWRVDRGSNKVKGNLVGAIVNSKSGLRYRNVLIQKVPHKVHRIIWLMLSGEYPECYIDHINGDGLDNRRENLREATSAQNQRNQRKRVDNTSGYKGVSFDKDRGKYAAYIWVDKQKKHLGRFDDAYTAHLAYAEAAREYHGEFARVE